VNSIPNESVNLLSVLLAQTPSLCPIVTPGALLAGVAVPQQWSIPAHFSAAEHSDPGLPDAGLFSLIQAAVRAAIFCWSASCRAKSSASLSDVDFL
jgi:hypothetical protein